MNVQYPTPRDFLAGNLLPFAQTVKAGDLIFTAGLVSPDVVSPTPYREFPVRHQTKGIYSNLSKMLVEQGTSLKNSLSLLQYFRGRGQTGAYIEARKKFYPDGVPTSTGIACTGLITRDAVLQIDGIVAVPSASKPVRHHGGTHDKAAYSNAVSFGDLIFLSGTTASVYPSTAAFSGGLGTTIPKEAQVDPNFWFGIPVQPQIRFLMEKKLKPIVTELEIGFENIAYAHVHLENISVNLPGFLETWKDLYSGAPPLTVISPSSGMGALGALVEVTPIALFPSGGTVVSDVKLEGAESFCGLGPLARRIGNHVFTSTLVAADEIGIIDDLRGPLNGPQLFDRAELEMDFILDRLEAICAAEGGSLDHVVKVRVAISSMSSLPGAFRPLHHRLKGRAAINIVEHSGNANWVPGCTLSVDAVAHIP